MMQQRLLNPASVYGVLFFIFHVPVVFYAIYFRDGHLPAHVNYIEDDLELLLIFICYWLILFWVGYFVASRVIHRRRKFINYSSLDFLFFPRQIVRYAQILLLIELFALAAYIYVTGGLSGFLTNHRELVYQNQWDRSGGQQYIDYIRISSGLVFLFSTVFAGVAQGVYKNCYSRHRVLFFLLVLPGAAVKVALLSRGVFLFPVIYLFSYAVVVGVDARKLLTVGSIVFLALVGGIVFALDMRGYEDIGENIFDALFFTAFNGLSTVLNIVVIAPELNFWNGIGVVVAQLSFLPSFLMSAAEGYENNLTPLLFGESEGSSMPMPFLGELFFNLRFFAILCAPLIGWWCALVAKRMAEPNVGRVNPTWVLLYCTTVFWFVYMPHSGLRATTRPLVWLALMIGTLVFLKSFKSKAR